MNISSKEVAYRKRIGHLHGADVLEIGTIGGRHLVVAAGAGDWDVLGAASHPAVARHQASRHQGLVIDSLAKSEPLDPTVLARMLPEANRLLAALRAARG